jgi:hypothetical protein
MAWVRTVEVANSRREGVPMSGQTNEAEQQHLMLMVDSAQRAGLSETEISKIVDGAAEADADLERAA